MNKRYKITIEEEVDESVLSSGAWTVVDEVNGDRKYGNPPQVELEEKVTRTIFKQNTDNLDLVEVIKAINGIKE